MREWLKLAFSKENILRTLRNFFFILLGTFCLVVASAFGLAPFSLVSGGITGITILLSNYIDPSILNYIFYWGFFVIGLLFLGERFTINTLISTITYPIMYNLMTATGAQQNLVNLLVNYKGDVSPSDIIWNNGVITNLADLPSVTPGFLLIIGIICGVLVGVGCGLTFRAGASSGGFDNLVLIISKYTGCKENIPFFAIDGSIVVIGIIVNIVKGNGTYLLAGIIGIIVAIIASLMVDRVSNASGNQFVLDVISDKTEEILDYAINVMNRSATIINVVGGYSKEDKKMVRIEFTRGELVSLRNAITRIDKKAFCTFYSAEFIGGEGFSKMESDKPSLFYSIKKRMEAKKNKENNK